MSNNVEYRFDSAGLGPADEVQVYRFEAHEAVSEPYRFELELLSANHDLDLDALLAQPASFYMQVGGHERTVHGILSDVRVLGLTGELSRYGVTLVPRLWRLGLTETNEVYLQQSVPEIVQAVLEECDLTSADVDMRLQRSYRTWDYLCQFGENHLDFVHRLMQREGMYYFFEQGGDAEKLVICDHVQYQTDIDSPEVIYQPPTGMDTESYGDRVFALQCERNRLPKKVLLRDYNDDNPSVDMRGEAEVDANGTGEVYSYGEHLTSQDEGAELADIRAEEIRARKAVYRGEGMVVRLSPGYRFTLSEHFRSSFNQSYQVLRLDHQGRAPQFMDEAAPGVAAYDCQFTAIEADVQYRPPRSAPKPRFFGTINAVVDAEGDGQYAEIDDEGRYRVILPFDRVQRQEGKASHWIRMAQPYGGEQEGMHFPLRKGAEVLLTFIGGDPDRPVIASTVPNAAQRSVVNSENQTKSKIQTSAGNMIEIEDQEDKKRVKLYSPQSRSYMHLGSANAPGTGIVSVTTGIWRNEIGGGWQETLITKSVREAWETEEAELDDDGNPVVDPADAKVIQGVDDQVFNEQNIFTFDLRGDDGAKTRDMTAADELSGDYHIWRWLGDRYEYADGNVYDYGIGGGKRFEFGNDYTEIHFSSTGIEDGEVFDFPTSMTGASRWDMGSHFVEKCWGDKFEYHNGAVYNFGRDSSEFNFGSAYTENHTAFPPSGINQNNTFDTYNGTNVQIDASDAFVEKNFGDVYGFTAGRTLEIFDGRFEERFYGMKFEYQFGGFIETFLGFKNETCTAAANATFLGIVNEMTFGLKNELFLGACASTCIASQIDMTFGAKLEVDLATKIDMTAGGALEAKANKVQSCAQFLGMRGNKLEANANKILTVGSTITSAGAYMRLGGILLFG